MSENRSKATEGDILIDIKAHICDIYKTHNFINIASMENGLQRLEAAITDHGYEVSPMFEIFCPSL